MENNQSFCNHVFVVVEFKSLFSFLTYHWSVSQAQGDIIPWLYFISFSMHSPAKNVFIWSLLNCINSTYSLIESLYINNHAIFTVCTEMGRPSKAPEEAIQRWAPESIAIIPGIEVCTVSITTLCCVSLWLPKTSILFFKHQCFHNLVSTLMGCPFMIFCSKILCYLVQDKLHWEWLKLFAHSKYHL